MRILHRRSPAHAGNFLLDRPSNPSRIARPGFFLLSRVARTNGRQSSGFPRQIPRKRRAPPARLFKIFCHAFRIDHKNVPVKKIGNISRPPPFRGGYKRKSSEWRIFAFIASPTAGRGVLSSDRISFVLWLLDRESCIQRGAIVSETRG